MKKALSVFLEKYFFHFYNMKESALIPASHHVSDTSKRILSTELEKKIELSNSQIYDLGHKVKKYKKRLNDAEEKMDAIMGKETEKERQAVEEALSKLRDKISKVQEGSDYKNLEKEAQYLEEKLNITMENIFPHYAKAVRRIYNSYPDKSERSQKLIEFHQVIGDAFLTKDEKKVLSALKNQMKQIPHRIVEVPLLIDQ